MKRFFFYLSALLMVSTVALAKSEKDEYFESMRIDKDTLDKKMQEAIVFSELTH
jgi:hypothetical protein